MSGSADRRILFWIQERRGYNSTFILEARPGSLRLVHPTLRAWYIRIAALVLPFVLQFFALYLAWGPMDRWTRGESNLAILGFVTWLAVFFILSGRPSLAYLANHPERVEDRARVLRIRRTGRSTLDKILVEAWGSAIWLTIVTKEAKLRAALVMAGQAEPEIERPHAQPA